MTKRQEAALETKRKLLEAGKNIISEKGLTNTSIEEITKACGVSNGTFYTYFKRKEDILYAVSYEVFQEIFENAKHYKGTFEERFIFYMINFSRCIEESSLKLCQEWIKNTVNPELVDNEQDRNKIFQDIKTLEQLIEQGMEQNELSADTPKEMLARTITDILYGEMLCWCMTNGAYSFEQRTKEFCDNYLDGMIKPYLLDGKDM